MKFLTRTFTALSLGVTALSASGASPQPDTQTSAVSVNYQQGAYRSERVQFKSEGVNVVGLLYTPSANNKAKHPGVVILGPFGSIKEQSPMEYATRLARDGFVVLIFDPRYSGESGGEPRRFESIKAKVADLKAALGFLAQQPQVDPQRLAGLGICQGSTEMLTFAADEPRLKVVSTVSGQYIYPKNIDGFFKGAGGPSRTDRIARGKAAKAKFDADGTVEYTTVVSPTDKTVGLPWKQINDWYQPWTTEKWMKPSRWENRYTTMSDAEVWSFDIDTYLPKVKLPTLVIHGEMSDGMVEAAQHVYKLLGATDKHLSIVPGVFHTRFYDDPAVIEPAAAEVSQWFKKHLL